MIEIKDVYYAYRKAQSEISGKPFRIPKDFDLYLESKMPAKNIEYLEAITKYFNTKWRVINPKDYFSCGFEIFGPNFTYYKFLDNKVLRLYIVRDKAKKLNKELNSKTFQNSVDFVIKYMRERGYNSDFSLIRQYCSLTEQREKVPIKHYQENKIDKYFLTWILLNGYLIIDDIDRAMIPLIVSNYRLYTNEIENFGDILNITKYIK